MSLRALLRADELSTKQSTLTHTERELMFEVSGQYTRNFGAFVRERRDRHGVLAHLAMAQSWSLIIGSESAVSIYAKL